MHPDYSDCSTFLLAKGTVPVQQSIHIFVQENPDQLSFLDWLEDPVSQYWLIREDIPEPKQKIISGTKWLVFGKRDEPIGFAPSGGIHWVALLKDKIFLIGLLNLGYEEYKPTVELMLSTLEFLES